VSALLDEIRRADGHVIFAADGVDTRQPGARQIIAVLAEQARTEADAASWRLSQWHAHNRRSGLWKRIRPYGYVVRDGRLSPHAAEAPIVRSMVDSFLAGSSLRGIAKRLNAQGVKPPRLVFYEEAMAKGYTAKRPPASSWSYIAVRGILTAPALAGLISHRGEPCRDEHGKPITDGVGIVTLEERSQILSELRDRAAVVRGLRTAHSKTGLAQPRYLLTGFGRCGARDRTDLGLPRQPDRRHLAGCPPGPAPGIACRIHTTGLGLWRRRPGGPQGAHRLDWRGTANAT
jgi:hypothetical protein